MGYHAMRGINPVVLHVAREWLHGAPPIHALWQAAAAGYFMGRGLSAHHAIRMVERLESPAVHGLRGPYYERTQPLWAAGAFDGDASDVWGLEAMM